MKKCLLICSVLLLSFPLTVNAQTGYPMVMSLKPVALQAGASAGIEFNTRYSMFGAYEVLVTGSGVSGEVLHPETKAGETPSLTKMKVRFTADPAALCGVRDVKIATPQGVSTVGQLVIVQDPVVYETGNNNTREEANELPVPGTACGVIEKNEDIDYFGFEVEAGEQLNFHVRCGRLQDRIHDLRPHADPMITIRNSMGGTVAANDNHFFADSFLSVEFERAGEYFLEIRDVRYQGGKYWEYSVEVTDRPFVSNLYPMGLPIGQPAEVELVGTRLPDDPRVKINLPADTAEGPVRKQLDLESGRSNTVAAFATRLPVTSETGKDNNTPETAQKLSLPAGINGRISENSDVDCFRFAAKKGEEFTFEVRARRYQSSLDPYLRIINLDGRRFAENDDLKNFKRTFADSRVDNWKAPADGEYAVEIRDLHLRGGDGFVYFIEATRAEPHFELYADTDKTLLAPGSNGVVFVSVERKNGFTGEVQLHADGLPESVEAVCGRILPDKGRDGCIILRAAPDAKQTVGNIRIYGTSNWKPSENAEPLDLRADATIYQEIYQPGGGRGHWPVETHTVSIGAPQDVRAVKLSEHDIVLKPGESKKIDVEIERAEGFTKNVSLDMRFFHLREFCNTLPPGVTFDESQSSKLITGKNETGHVVVTAGDKAAPVNHQLVPVTANVSLNFVMKTTFSAAPLWITVAPPEE